MDNILLYIYNCKQIRGLILKFRTFRLEPITNAASKYHVTVFPAPRKFSSSIVPLVILLDYSVTLLKQALLIKVEAIRNIVCKMVYFRRFIFLMRSENLLCTRNCLLNLYQNSSRSALRQLKDTILPPKPKKPEGSFFLYVKHIKLKFLEETPDISHAQLLKRASKQWAELDLDEKEYFTNQYYKNREVYMNELKEYNNSITNEQRELWEKKKKEYLQYDVNLNNKRKYEMLGKPRKSLNPFLCYVTSKKNDKNPNISFKDWVKLLSTSWKELSGAEKESYINKATQLKIQYQKDLEKWEVEMIHSGHPDVVRSKILKKYKNIEDKNKE